MASIDEIEEGSKVDHSININQILDSSIKSRTMFKVNVTLRESNPDAYTPKMVSIGPYHRGDVQLHRMEKCKWLYLRRFLGRKEGLDVESCIKELEGLKEEALKCYDDVETDAFCQMLLLDGCFVVEFIRERYGMCPDGEDRIMNSAFCIERDLILLENQLPFFVIDKLHDMTKQDGELALVMLASNVLLTFFVKLPKMTIGTFTGGNIKHLLHLYHAISCHDQTRPMDSESFIEAGGCCNIKNILHLVCRHLGHAGNSMKKPNDDYCWYMDMPNATQLSEAGVRFEMHQCTSIFDIKFENGSMSIPQFRVTDDTKFLLRNLIAYEQQSVDVEIKYFSDFVFFMDNLIRSDKDVTLLRRKGIIQMKMGTEKQVANLFNKIASAVTVSSNFYYIEELRKAAEYYENNITRAVFVRYFFKNALTTASTILAFIGLMFTGMQTILAYTGPIRK